MTEVGDDDQDWYQYQQNEIDGAKENIEDRLEHVAGRVYDGLLDGEKLNEHQNSRLEAYLEGYADGLDYAHDQVERIDNLVKYVDQDGEGDRDA